MDLHILLDPVTDFDSAPKRGLKMIVWHFLKPKVGGLIGSTKTQFKNLKFGMVVN